MEKKSTTQGKRVFEGTVISAKMAKTVVVLVERLKTNAKYKKQFRQSTTFKIHDEKGECKVGDVVRFVETRPLSKDKRWRFTAKVTK